MLSWRNISEKIKPGINSSSIYSTIEYSNMIAIFAILLACSCLINAVPQFQQVSKLNERIVGGEVTYIEEYPYQASLQYVYKHVCGAVIISENYVVTAAHCTDGYM